MRHETRCAAGHILCSLFFSTAHLRGSKDKMAEVIGIVSGAITFATVVAQISKSIIQIKDCWSQIRDAPEELQELISELEIYDLILREIERNKSSGPLANAIDMSEHSFQSLEICKKAAERLQIISKDLAKDLFPSSRFRRTYSSFKTVLQKSKVEKYKAKLSDSIRLLSLSQQCYSMYFWLNFPLPSLELIFLQSFNADTTSNGASNSS
jgi:hypothetical protein